MINQSNDRYIDYVVNRWTTAGKSAVSINRHFPPHAPSSEWPSSAPAATGLGHPGPPLPLLILVNLCLIGLLLLLSPSSLPLRPSVFVACACCCCAAAGGIDERRRMGWALLVWACYGWMESKGINRRETATHLIGSMGTFLQAMGPRKVRGD
jgi:hypothetical protein